MKTRVIALALFTVFTAGVSSPEAKSFSSGPSAAERETILPAPVEPTPVDRGLSPSYAGGCANPSLETANTLLRFPRMSSGYGISDLMGTDRVSMPLKAYIDAVSPPASRAPAAVQSCAPRQSCLFTGCWYELLDNTDFDQPSDCAPNWIFPAGYVLPSSSICNSNPFLTTFSKVAVLPYASGFSQSFSVPAEPGYLGVALIFAIVGTPTFNDRLVVDVIEGTIIRRTIKIRTDLGRFSCHREDHALLGEYAGKNLKLRVRSQIVTPGVEYHLNSITLFYTPWEV
jgi:hypothetical protein